MEREEFYQSEESENEEEVAIEKLRTQAQGFREEDFFPEFEEPELDFESLTQEEKMMVVEKDSPELMPVLKLLKGLLRQYREDMEIDSQRLTKQARQMMRLRKKYRNLLGMNIAFYIYMKSLGKQTSTHPLLETIKKLEELQQSLQLKEDIIDKPGKNNNPSDSRLPDKEILKTQGIKRNRKKIERNVRAKNRGKYERAVKKRRSTYGIKEYNPPTHYQGENTGIRKNLVKGVKLNN